MKCPFFIFKLPKYADNIGFNERISEGLYSQVMCRVLFPFYDFKRNSIESWNVCFFFLSLNILKSMRG